MGINFTIQFLIQFDTFHFEIKFDYNSLHDELENPKILISLEFDRNCRISPNFGCAL